MTRRACSMGSHSAIQDGSHLSSRSAARPTGRLCTSIARQCQTRQRSQMRMHREHSKTCSIMGIRRTPCAQFRSCAESQGPPAVTNVTTSVIAEMRTGLAAIYRPTSNSWALIITSMTAKRHSPERPDQTSPRKPVSWFSWGLLSVGFSMGRLLLCKR
jgi:hypothetical protein